MPLAHIASGSGCSIRPPTTSSASSPSTAIVEAFDHRRTPLRKRDPQPFSLASSSSTVLASPPIRPLSDTLLLALRQRPSTRLFRALFQYIPIRDSPNENPQLELPLQAGDYILVHGEMDEDQFYHGETLDGHTGLVPSNYVERVSEQQLLLNSSRAPSPSFPLIIPSHLTQISHDFTTTSTASQPSSPLPDSVCPYPPVDVSKVTVQEIKEVDAPRVPFPRELTVEKKMSRSVVLSWSVPDDSLTPVSQYHVCVDGVVRAVVPGSFKCKALVEDIDLSRAVNISVRAVTESGHSPDAACTVSLGKDSPVAPQHVRAWLITPVSACISWYPSNSNAEHVILLNAVKVGVSPPTVFQVQLKGLSPSTIYRVSVRTKHPKAVLEQRPVERCVDFKTLPKIGLPEPPSNVQVEVGPQPGTLLVSWTPVSTQPLPPSRAAVHSYLIYADGRNIAQVPNAGADHILLRLSDFADDPPLFITVRTRTREGAVSSDSNVSRVPRGMPLTLPGTLPRLTATGMQLGSQIAAPSMYQPTMTTNAIPTNLGMAPAVSEPRLLPSTRLALGLPDVTLPMAQSTYNDPMAIRVPTAFSAPGSEYTRTLQGRPKYGYGATADMLIDGSLQQYQSTGALQEWRPQGQYYTFHPNLLRREGTGAEEKPSVLEMEQNYLLKHRSGQQWPSLSQTTRGRLENYVRNRCVSADEQQPFGARGSAIGTRSLLPHTLARVRSEELCSTRSEPDLRPMALDDYSCRWFVALFDYSHHMSPNVNAQQEELSFRKHQLIKVFGEVDQDGFYTGQIGHRIGLVPSNLVIEIAKDDVLPHRRRSDAMPEPSIRRMRWGSLKSRSYDHAGDRRQPHHRQAIEPEYYSLISRRDHSHPRREVPFEYGPSRRAIEGRGELPLRGGEYSGRGEMERVDYGGRVEREERFESYPNGRHPREHHYYPRDYRSRDSQERERRDYYRDERDVRDIPERDLRDPRDLRELRDRPDARDYRDPRDRELRMEGREIKGDMREYRDSRDIKESAYSRDVSASRREPKEYLDDREDRLREYRDVRDYRDQRETREPDYRDIRKERAEAGKIYDDRSYGSCREARGYDRREYGRMEKGQELYRGDQETYGGPITQRYDPQLVDEGRYGRTNGGEGALQVRKMVAKFDYDSRQLSPNVDAEQVELSFRAGDVITVYGEMDEDGFYMGELNGIKGLVPSNFLQTSPVTSLMPSQMPPAVQPTEAASQPIPPITIPVPEQARAKGVAFQESTRRVMPARQSSRDASSSKQSGMPKSTKTGTLPSTQKSVSKKLTESSVKASGGNSRKTSQGAKKVEGVGLKKKS